MSMTDDLKDYIARNGTTKTNITERYSVAIVGETHAFLRRTDSEIRTRATVRLLLELLSDSKHRYFGNESYLNKGLVRKGVREYVRGKILPPPFDPKQAGLDLMTIGERVLVRRYQEVLDFIRANPRYILSIGTMLDGSAARDARLAQHFFEEMADRKLRTEVPGVLLLGASHAAAVSDEAWATTRILIEQRGYACVSIRALTDFNDGSSSPDDLALPLGTPLDKVIPSDIIRLTSLVAKTPVTIPTDRPWTNNRPSPLRQLTFGASNTSIADQFEYLVLQKG
jgi:hypothetical protein